MWSCKKSPASLTLLTFAILSDLSMQDEVLKCSMRRAASYNVPWSAQNGDVLISFSIKTADCGKFDTPPDHG